MTSPFAPYANAVLRFEVSSGALVPDRNGNMRPGVAVVEATAVLQEKRDSNKSNFEQKEIRPGVDSSSIFLEGYLIEPLPLPSVVTPDSRAEAIWQGRQGVFYMEFAIRNPYLMALNIDLVERIRGYFSPGSYAVTGDTWQPPPQPPAIESDGHQYSNLLTAGSALSALRIVTLVNGQLLYADCLNRAHAFSVVGILPSAVGSGESIRVLSDGAISDSNWSWDSSRPVWLGELGALTQSPGAAGFLLQVATVIDSTTLDFEIQEAILL